VGCVVDRRACSGGTVADLPLVPGRVAATNAFGFGGQNCVAVFRAMK
jgi:3-oxoacyl-(acyl-carrier-protein) synthase